MLLPGALEMAQRSLGMPVRLGVPRHVGGLVDVIDSPIFATAVGLVIAGMRGQARGVALPRDAKVLAKVKHKMSDWLSDFF
jgi:cell division protein FtsA